MFDHISHAKKRAFLAAYSQVANIGKAAIVADCARYSHYLWLRDDPGYAEAFRKAKELACDSLEDEAVRRAHEGIDKPVYQGGKKVGVVREYSDTLLIFLLKGAMPDKYRERISQEITGKVEIAERLAAGRQRLAKHAE